MKENNKYSKYSPEEIDTFLNGVIAQVEKMIEESKIKNEIIISKEKRIQELEAALAISLKENEKAKEYESMKNTINNAVDMAKKTSEDIRNNIKKECDFMLEDARRNASRIVNEALLKAEKAEADAENLKRNVKIFKRKIRDIIEAQLVLVDDMEKVEF